MAISRSGPTASRIASHSAAVRWSFQRIAGRRIRSAASRRTRPCICPARPTAATSSPLTPAVSRTERIAAIAPVHQSSGSCSLQSGRGTSYGYSPLPIARTAPLSSTRTAFVAVVETSSPRTKLIARRRPSEAVRSPSPVCSAAGRGGRPLRGVDRPDRPVDDVLEELLAAGHWGGIDLAGRHPFGQGGEIRLAGEDRLTERAVPVRVALGPEPLEPSVLDQGGRDKQRASERVDAADVGVEEVMPVHALAAELGVEVEPAAREASRPD